jgi:hypothetical protein
VNFKSIAITSARFGHQSLALRRSRNARGFSAGVIAFPFAAGRPRFLVTGVIAVGDLVTLATGLVTLSVFASALGSGSISGVTSFRGAAISATVVIAV